MTFGMPSIDPNAPGEVLFGLRGSSSANSLPVQAPQATSEEQPVINQPTTSRPISVPELVAEPEPESQEDAIYKTYRQVKAQRRRTAADLAIAREEVRLLDIKLADLTAQEDVLRLQLAELLESPI